jgi:hypothetical protein
LILLKGWLGKNQRWTGWQAAVAANLTKESKMKVERTVVVRTAILAETLFISVTGLRAQSLGVRPSLVAWWLVGKDFRNILVRNGRGGGAGRHGDGTRAQSHTSSQLPGTAGSKGRAADGRQSPALEPDRTEWMLPLEIISGIPVVELSTTHGMLRMVIDTGSNGTTLDDFRDENIVVHLEGLDISMKVYSTATPVLARFNASVGKKKAVRGIMGNDFFSHFDLFTLDYQHGKLTLIRWKPTD